MFTLKDTVEISVPVGSKQRLNNLSCSTEKKPLKKGELKLFYSDNLSSNKFPDSWKEGVSTLVHFFLLSFGAGIFYRLCLTSNSIQLY